MDLHRIPATAEKQSKKGLVCFLSFSVVPQPKSIHYEAEMSNITSQSCVIINVISRHTYCTMLQTLQLLLLLPRGNIQLPRMIVFLFLCGGAQTLVSVDISNGN